MPGRTGGYREAGVDASDLGCCLGGSLRAAVLALMELLLTVESVEQVDCLAEQHYRNCSSPAKKAGVYCNGGQ